MALVSCLETVFCHGDVSVREFKHFDVVATVNS